MRFGPFSFFEKKTLSDPTADEFTILTGFAPGDVNPLTVPAVQSCIRLISEAAASLEIKVERKVGDTWQAAPDHQVAQLLANQPNDWTSTFALVRDLVAAALTNDKGALALVNRVNGRVIEIVRYEAPNFVVDYSADGRMEPSFRINNVPVKAEDVILLRGTFSRCPLSLAADAINAAKHMERHAANLFENAARPGGVIQTPKSIGDEGVKRMLKGWRTAQEGSGNAGKTPVLWDSAEFKPMTLASTDAQFLENRTQQNVEICRAFRTPPSMIYELDRATWSNIEQMGKEFIVYSLGPWLRLLEAAMRRALFTDDERASYRIRFDTDDLTQADLTARATAISSLISSRTLNPNEARSWLGLPPREGGDEYANPNTGSSQPGNATDKLSTAPRPANDEARDAA